MRFTACDFEHMDCFLAVRLVARRGMDIRAVGWLACGVSDGRHLEQAFHSLAEEPYSGIPGRDIRMDILSGGDMGKGRGVCESTGHMRIQDESITDLRGTRPHDSSFLPFGVRLAVRQLSLAAGLRFHKDVA